MVEYGSEYYYDTFLYGEEGMSGLNPVSIDLAITSKQQLARLVLEYLPSRYTLFIGSSPGLYTIPARTAGAGTDATKIVDSAAPAWVTDQWKNFIVNVYRAGIFLGSGVITANDATTLSVAIAAAPTTADTYDITYDVNPSLGNNFQMDWVASGGYLLIHNDFPIYSGGDYYYIGGVPPLNLDVQILLASLTGGSTGSATPYNHIFFVNGVAHTGSLSTVATASQTKPTDPSGTLVYLGWVYRGYNDEIIVKNNGQLIDTAFSQKVVSYIDFLDYNKGNKVIIAPTNILRIIGFFGPNITTTIKEVGLFIRDGSSVQHMVAYAKVAAQALTASESLRVIWKLII